MTAFAKVVPRECRWRPEGLRTFTLLPHETNRKRKLLLKTAETRLFSFVNSDGSEGRRWYSTMELLLWPTDVWMEDRKEPWQPKELWRWILDLIDKQEEK
jgi:hypothetical protein